MDTSIFKTINESVNTTEHTESSEADNWNDSTLRQLAYNLADRLKAESPEEYVLGHLWHSVEGDTFYAELKRLDERTGRYSGTIRQSFRFNGTLLDFKFIDDPKPFDAERVATYVIRGDHYIRADESMFESVKVQKKMTTDYALLKEMQNIPRGDRTIDDLDQSGELADHMASNLNDVQTMRFSDLAVAEHVKALLDKWGIEAEIVNREPNVFSQDRHVVKFFGDETLKNDITKELGKGVK